MVLEMNEINHVQHDMAGSGTLSGERQGGSGRLRRRHFQHQKSDLFKNRNRADLPSQNSSPSVIFEESKRYSSMKTENFRTVITALWSNEMNVNIIVTNLTSIKNITASDD